MTYSIPLVTFSGLLPLLSSPLDCPYATFSDNSSNPASDGTALTGFIGFDSTGVSLLSSIIRCDLPVPGAGSGGGVGSMPSTASSVRSGRGRRGQAANVPPPVSLLTCSLVAAATNSAAAEGEEAVRKAYVKVLYSIESNDGMISSDDFQGAKTWLPF